MLSDGSFASTSVDTEARSGSFAAIGLTDAMSKTPTRSPSLLAAQSQRGRDSEGISMNSASTTPQPVVQNRKNVHFGFQGFGEMAQRYNPDNPLHIEGQSKASTLVANTADPNPGLERPLWPFVVDASRSTDLCPGARSRSSSQQQFLRSQASDSFSRETLGANPTQSSPSVGSHPRLASTQSPQHSFLPAANSPAHFDEVLQGSPSQFLNLLSVDENGVQSQLGSASRIAPGETVAVAQQGALGQSMGSNASSEARPGLSSYAMRESLKHLTNTSPQVLEALRDDPNAAPAVSPHEAHVFHHMPVIFKYLSEGDPASNSEASRTPLDASVTAFGPSGSAQASRYDQHHHHHHHHHHCHHQQLQQPHQSSSLPTDGRTALNTSIRRASFASDEHFANHFIPEAAGERNHSTGQGHARRVERHRPMSLEKIRSSDDIASGMTTMRRSMQLPIASPLTAPRTGTPKNRTCSVFENRPPSPRSQSATPASFLKPVFAFPTAAVSPVHPGRVGIDRRSHSGSRQDDRLERERRLLLLDVDSLASEMKSAIAAIRAEACDDIITVRISAKSLTALLSNLSAKLRQALSIGGTMPLHLLTAALAVINGLSRLGASARQGIRAQRKGKDGTAAVAPVASAGPSSETPSGECRTPVAELCNNSSLVPGLKQAIDFFQIKKDGAGRNSSTDNNNEQEGEAFCKLATIERDSAREIGVDPTSKDLRRRSLLLFVVVAFALLVLRLTSQVKAFKSTVPARVALMLGGSGA